MLVSGEFPDTKLVASANKTTDLVIQECEINKQDYLIMINDLHNLLKNCKDLSNNEKLEYCNSERHYMKEYLKHALIKINTCFPD